MSISFSRKIVSQRFLSLHIQYWKKNEILEANWMVVVIGFLYSLLIRAVVSESGSHWQDFVSLNGFSCLN